jgi:hypothetical protein
MGVTFRPEALLEATVGAYIELLDKAHTSSRREVDFSLGRPPSRPSRIWSDGGALPAGVPHVGRERVQLL